MTHKAPKCINYFIYFYFIKSFQDEINQMTTNNCFHFTYYFYSPQELNNYFIINYYSYQSL